MSGRTLGSGGLLGGNRATLGTPAKLGDTKPLDDPSYSLTGDAYAAAHPVVSTAAVETSLLSASTLGTPAMDSTIQPGPSGDATSDGGSAPGDSGTGTGTGDSGGTGAGGSDGSDGAPGDS